MEIDDVLGHFKLKPGYDKDDEEMLQGVSLKLKALLAQEDGTVSAQDWTSLSLGRKEAQLHLIALRTVAGLFAYGRSLGEEDLNLAAVERRLHLELQSGTGSQRSPQTRAASHFSSEKFLQNLPSPAGVQLQAPTVC